MKVAIWGATGATGSELLRQCLAEGQVAEVVVFGRRASGFESAKVREVIVNDFADGESYRGALQAVDVAFWCMGASQSAVPDEARYRQITLDYALVAARALKEASPAADFHFVSAMGAGTGGALRPMWARVKGETEAALAGVGFCRLMIWRPGYIFVPGGRRSATTWERLWEILSPLFRLVPGLVNPIDEIARAMLREVLAESDRAKEAVTMRTSRDIRSLAEGR